MFELLHHAHLLHGAGHLQQLNTDQSQTAGHSKFCQWATGSTTCTTTGTDQDKIAFSNGVWKLDRDGKITLEEVQSGDLDDVFHESAHEDWHDMPTLRCIAGILEDNGNIRHGGSVTWQEFKDANCNTITTAATATS